jgi:hypothetical protein
MTLDYKILWIDDHEDFFRNHEDFIKEHIEEKGFEAQIIKHKSLQDYLEHDDNKVEQIKYDLFLVDLNLDNGHTGNEIIEKIRSNKVLTDIIFYSTNLADVRRSVNDNNIEGVFVTSRNQNDFEEKVTDVIDVTIKKVQDVNNLRGLIMAEVAELDRIKERILVQYSTIKSDRSIESYLLEKLKKSYDDNLKKVESHAKKSITEIIDNLYVDSDKKARAVKKINPSFDESAYRISILKKRNSFAHVEENIIDGQRMIGDIPFTEDECVKIRKDIREYKSILEVIEKEL